MARAINPAALREIRDLVGISQRELARRCGCSQQAVDNAENSRTATTPELQRKFADALGVKLDAITIPVPQAEPVTS